MTILIDYKNKKIPNPCNVIYNIIHHTKPQIKPLKYFLDKYYF